MIYGEKGEIEEDDTGDRFIVVYARRTGLKGSFDLSVKSACTPPTLRRISNGTNSEERGSEKGGESNSYLPLPGSPSSGWFEDDQDSQREDPRTCAHTFVGEENEDPSFLQLYGCGYKCEDGYTENGDITCMVRRVAFLRAPSDIALKREVRVYF